MTLPPPLTLTYWFTSYPAPFMPIVAWAHLAIFGALTVIGIAAYILSARKGTDPLMSRLFAKTGAAGLSTGLIGLFLCGVEYERIPILSIRIAYLALLAWFVWSVWQIVQYARRDIPEIRKRAQEYQAFTKWLPKKKK